MISNWVVPLQSSLMVPKYSMHLFSLKPCIITCVRKQAKSCVLADHPLECFGCPFQEIIAQTRDKEAAAMTEVSWRGHTVPVKNEKVRSFILHAQQSARELERADTLDSKLTLYDNLLMECKDALQAIKDELKGDTVSSTCTCCDCISCFLMVHGHGILSYFDHQQNYSQIEGNLKRHFTVLNNDRKR